MYKKSGGIIIIISFVIFVFSSIYGTIGEKNGYVPPFLTIFFIIGLLGMISGSILYFMGKSQEKKLSKENTHESIAGGANLFCSKCGSKTKSDDKFCVKCGSVIEK